MARPFHAPQSELPLIADVVLAVTQLLGSLIAMLYHFTAEDYLPAICKYGLTVGDVPTDTEKGKVGVWLTASEDPRETGLERSRRNKKRYRLTVDLYDKTHLCKWSDWFPKNVKPEIAEGLHETAGDWQNWFVYFGVIGPEGIVDCVDMNTGKSVDWRKITPNEVATAISPSRRKAWQKQLHKQVKRSEKIRQLTRASSLLKRRQV